MICIYTMISANNFRGWIGVASCAMIFTACLKEPSGLPKPPEPDNLTDTVLLKVSYGEEARQVYDIHLPAKRDSATPVIVMVHGKRGGRKTLTAISTP